MEEGISIDEACAHNVVGTKEDFERLCNPDGTVKKQTATTTFSHTDSGNSITISNTHLQIGGVSAAIIAIILTILVIRKLKSKKT